MKIIKFNAIWCPGCLVMKSRWKKVCNEIPDLDITNYDYDIDTDMVKKYNIGKILPVTIFLNKEEEIERLIGEISYDKLIETINKYRGF